MFIALLLAIVALALYYCLKCSQQQHADYESRSRQEAQLLNQLSIRQNDLEHHQRWLKKFNTDDDAALCLIHTQAIVALERDILDLKRALTELRSK